MLSRTLTVSIKLHYGQKSIIGYFTVHLSVTAMIDYLATTYATNKIVPFFFYLWKILFCLVPCIFLLYTVTQHHVVSILLNDSLLHIIHVQSDITETKKSLHRQIDCDELASIFICKKERKKNSYFRCSTWNNYKISNEMVVRNLTQLLTMLR